MTTLASCVLALGIFAGGAMAFADGNAPQTTAAATVQPQQQSQTDAKDNKKKEDPADPKHGFAFVAAGAKATFTSNDGNSYAGVLYFGGAETNKYDKKGYLRYWFQGNVSGEYGISLDGTYPGVSANGQYNLFVTPFKCGPYAGVGGRLNAEVTFGSSLDGVVGYGANGEVGYTCRTNQLMYMLGVIGGVGGEGASTYTAQGGQVGGVARVALGKRLMASGMVLYTPSGQTPGSGTASEIEASADVAYTVHPKSPWVFDAQTKVVNVNAGPEAYGFSSSTSGQVMLLFGKSW